MLPNARIVALPPGPLGASGTDRGDARASQPVEAPEAGLELVSRRLGTIAGRHDHSKRVVGPRADERNASMGALSASADVVPVSLNVGEA